MVFPTKFPVNNPVDKNSPARSVAITERIGSIHRTHKYRSVEGVHGMKALHAASTNSRVCQKPYGVAIVLLRINVPTNFNCEILDTCDNDLLEVHITHS